MAAPAGSTSPAPDVRGTWNVAYDNTIGVEVKIGGAVYNAELGAAGGSFTINHQGKPYTFDLDCSRPDIVCPSEAWPNQVVVEQRDVQHQHQMVVDLPQASCIGALTRARARHVRRRHEQPELRSRVRRRRSPSRPRRRSA